MEYSNKKAEAAAFEYIWGKSMRELQEFDAQELRQFVLQFRDLLYDMPFQVPEDMILLGRCVGILSGLCTGLDPEFNVWKGIIPYAERLIQQETGPQWRIWMDELGNLARILLTYPKRIDVILGKMERGELSVREPQIVAQMSRLDPSVNRQTAGLIFAVLMLGGIQLTLTGQVAFGAVLLAGAGLTLGWILLSAIEEAIILCKQCNQQNPDEAHFCHQCGAKLAEAMAAAGTDSETPPARPVQDDETLWRQFIGPNADHYPTVFKKFSSNGQPKFALSWNWPAFLYLSFLWFLYRKMYLHAFVYAVGPMISTYLTGDFSAGIVWSIMAGATANYLYYWHCREHIVEIKKADRMDRAAQETALKESGGVQPYVIWVGVFFYIMFLATLVKMIQEGPPDLDKSPGRPAKQAAMLSRT